MKIDHPQSASSAIMSQDDEDRWINGQKGMNCVLFRLAWNILAFSRRGLQYRLYSRRLHTNCCETLIP